MPPAANKFYWTQTRQLFHCHIKIKIPISCSEALLDSCFELLEQIDRRYNSYQPGSYFDQINQQAGNWVQVDGVTVKLLKQLKFVSDCTGGQYDISSMPLLRCWGFYKQEMPEIPSTFALNEALGKVDYRKIELDGRRVRIAPDQELISGSFLKAYAVDQVILLLKKAGVRDALINAGGSSFAVLNRGDEPHWHIKIPDALNAEQKVARLPLTNQAFSLSASSGSFLEIAGKKYGHILNARTGWPVCNRQTGVVAETAFESDMIATALFCVPAELATDTVQKLQTQFRFSGFLIDENGQQYDWDFNFKSILL